jgi:OOP family OmpA-OmpF porin
MKSLKTISLSLIALATVYTANAQTFAQRLKSTTFVFGLHEHIVIDNGKEYQFKFDTKNWQLTPFPSKISAEAYLKKGWGLQTEFAYVNYKANTVVDNATLLKDNTFFAADLNVRYHFETLYLKPSFFDPFLTAGYGFTYRSAVNKTQTSIGTTNLGLGVNFWIYKGFGLSLQTVGKFALKGGAKSNYLHHSVGVVYKLKPVSNKPALKK